MLPTQKYAHSDNHLGFRNNKYIFLISNIPPPPQRAILINHRNRIFLVTLCFPLPAKSCDLVYRHPYKTSSLSVCISPSFPLIKMSHIQQKYNFLRSWLRSLCSLSCMEHDPTSKRRELFLPQPQIAVLQLPLQHR